MPARVIASQRSFAGGRIAVPQLRGWAVDRTLVGAEPPPETYSDKVNALSPLAYWRLQESSGATADNYEGTAARDAAYAGSGVTYGQTGIGDGLTSILTDGSDGLVNYYTANLNSNYDGAEGTFAGWVKVPSWDSSQEYALRFGDQINNDNVILKLADDTYQFKRKGGGTEEMVTSGVQSSTDWVHLAITWSESTGADGEFKAYIDAIQVGATQTSLGTWNAAALNDEGNIIAAVNSGAAQAMNGNWAHWAIWTSALSGADITSLATV